MVKSRYKQEIETLCISNHNVFFYQYFSLKISVLSVVYTEFLGKDLTWIFFDKSKGLDPHIDYFLNFKLLLVLFIKDSDVFRLQDMTQRI